MFVPQTKSHGDACEIAESHVSESLESEYDNVRVNNKGEYTYHDVECTNERVVSVESSSDSIDNTETTRIGTEVYESTGEMQGTKADSFVSGTVNSDQQDIDSHNTGEERQQNDQPQLPNEIGEVLGASTEGIAMRPESVEDNELDYVQESTERKTANFD